MTRAMSVPQALTLPIHDNAEAASPISSAITSPSEPRSRSPSPGSPALQEASERLHCAQTQNGTQLNAQHQSIVGSASPKLTSLPPFPTSPKTAPKHIRDQSRSFFANLKASKSSNKIHAPEPTIRQVSEDSSRGHKELRENSLYSLRKSPGSTPDLSKSTFDNNSTDAAEGRVAQSLAPNEVQLLIRQS